MHYPVVSLFFVPPETRDHKTEFLISCLHLVLDTTALLFLINNPSLPNEVEHNDTNTCREREMDVLRNRSKYTSCGYLVVFEVYLSEKSTLLSVNSVRAADKFRERQE